MTHLPHLSLPRRGKVARRCAAVTDEVFRTEKKASRWEAFFSSYFSHRIVSLAAASAPMSVSVPLDAPIFSAAAANNA